MSDRPELPPEPQLPPDPAVPPSEVPGSPPEVPSPPDPVRTPQPPQASRLIPMAFRPGSPSGIQVEAAVDRRAHEDHLSGARRLDGR